MKNIITKSPKVIDMIERREIKFKSYPVYWNKESLGLKRNTVRKLDVDERFDLLNKWMCGKADLMISLENTNTGEIFTRDVTDVSEFEGYYIISW